MNASSNANANDEDKESEQMVKELNLHAQNIPINLKFPAEVISSEKSDQKNSGRITRTKAEFVNLRLLESGVLFDDSQTFRESATGVSEFISNLQETGCYDGVKVMYDVGEKEQLLTTETKDATDAGTDQGRSQTAPVNTKPLLSSLKVVLDEKKWYKLYIGGGLKQTSLDGIDSGSSSNLPKVQFETNASLLNLRGVTDITTMSYSIDQTSDRTMFISHDRPLFSLFPEYSFMYNKCVLAGTRNHFNVKACYDIDDHEWTRSYKQFNRGIQCTFSNRPGGSNSSMIPDIWSALTYSMSLRDIIPRRHPKLPYACDASPEIVAQTGPNLCHSVKYTYQTNGAYTDSKFNPTNGIDYSVTGELAGPPGDVGFAKVEGGGAVHFPVATKGLVLHASLYGGIMKALDFQGLCRDTTCISDRFFRGGPLQLRGFQPSGIGPRAKTGGRSVTGGDSLGGELYYTANIAASVPSPIFQDSGLRLFGFTNLGTLSNVNLKQNRTSFEGMMKSSRISVGGGACVATPMGRLELTYAVPLRFGAKDARKNLQFGFGFTFN